MLATGRTEGLAVDEVLLLVVLVVVIEEVRGGRDAVAVPGMLLVLLLLVLTAETVVTLDASEDASLPDEAVAPNSSSKEGREGSWAVLEGCSGEPENRSVFIAKWRKWKCGTGRREPGREGETMMLRRCSSVTATGLRSACFVCCCSCCSCCSCRLEECLIVVLGRRSSQGYAHHADRSLFSTPSGTFPFH